MINVKIKKQAIEVTRVEETKTMAESQQNSGSGATGEAAAGRLADSRADLVDWSSAADAVLSGEAPADATPPPPRRS